MTSKKPVTKPDRKKPKFGPRQIDINDSTLITKVFYDPDTDILDAIFVKGARYRYYDLTPKTFSQFVLATSMGDFFNKKIRKYFDYEKVSG
jgi:hypothetical protein